MRLDPEKLNVSRWKGVCTTCPGSLHSKASIGIVSIWSRPRAGEPELASKPLEAAFTAEDFDFQNHFYFMIFDRFHEFDRILNPRHPAFVAAEFRCAHPASYSLWAASTCERRFYLVKVGRVHVPGQDEIAARIRPARQRTVLRLASGIQGYRIKNPRPWNPCAHSRP